MRNLLQELQVATKAPCTDKCKKPKAKIEKKVKKGATHATKPAIKNKP